ncbi:MAG: hypothetical protein JNN11_04800 [Candidatus Doudnabacteria bacterium]|nr:hypothetical protein [Candidatus Doudnabacteria bacterium]
MGRDQKIKPRKLVHITLSQRLMSELTRLGGYEGKTAARMAAYLLECILPIAQTEKTYRLVPLEFDLGSPCCSLQPAMTPEEKDFLYLYAKEGGLSNSEQACQLLWLAVRFYDQYQRPGLLLRKEEFVSRVRRDIVVQREELLQPKS